MGGGVWILCPTPIPPIRRPALNPETKAREGHRLQRLPAVFHALDPGPGLGHCGNQGAGFRAQGLGFGDSGFRPCVIASSIRSGRT